VDVRNCNFALETRPSALGQRSHKGRCMLLCLPQIPSAWPEGPNRAMILLMRALLNLIRWMLLGLVRSRTSLEAENVALGHQLSVLCRSATKRPALSMSDRLVFILLYRLAPSVLNAMKIVRPETIVRWHRAGFRSFWRWKSHGRVGRARVALEVSRLIREMSLANPLWGAPRLHGELLKLGVDIGQTSVAKYMARRRRPPSQGRRTFLLNHADGIAAIDLFVVPRISFRLLYGLLVLGHGRRRILSLAVIAHPTAEWIARQVTEACAWESAPQYLIRDRDGVYGEAFTRRIAAMGIRDRPTAPRSPWQNGYAERLIGSIRRECLDHVVVFGKGIFAMCFAHMRSTTTASEHICHWSRTHR
jgi:transposase InsO family protein